MFKNINKYRNLFNKIYTKDKNLEEALLHIRKQGANQMESVRTLMLELSISLKEADDIVLKSNTWSDSKSNIENLRKTFEDTLDNDQY